MVSGCLNKEGLTLIYKKWNRWTLKIFCFVPKLSVEKRWSGKKNTSLSFVWSSWVCVCPSEAKVAEVKSPKWQAWRQKLFLSWRWFGWLFCFGTEMFHIGKNVISGTNLSNQSKNDYIILRVDFVWSKLLSYSYLGGRFKYVLCSSRTLGKWSNLTSIFFRWVGSTTN